MIFRIIIMFAAFTLLISVCGNSDNDNSQQSTIQPVDLNSVLPNGDEDFILFWTPEQQLAGYRNMEKVYDTNFIKASENPRTLNISDEALELSIEYAGKSMAAEEYMDHLNISGLLVIKDGEILTEHYHNGYGEGQRWISFSMSKSITSTLLGVAIKDGFINSVDDPVTLYLPELKGSVYEGVTIKHLITMTSGVAWNEDYSDPNSDVASYLLNPPNDGSSPVINYLSNLKRSAEPGTIFNYNTGETDMAGSLIFAATGKYLADYLTEKIWQPYGMETDANWLTITGGVEQGGCCVSASLRDFGRLGMFIMNDAKIDGVSIVPDNWIEMATTATAVSKEVDFLKDPETLQDGYGYFWWTVGSKAYLALGIFGQLIYVNPEMDLIIVTQSAWPTAIAYSDANRYLIEAVEEAVGK